MNQRNIRQTGDFAVFLYCQGLVLMNEMNYYLLEPVNSFEQGEYGLLMAQVTADGSIRLETHRDSFNPEEYPAFSGNELTLTR